MPPILQGLAGQVVNVGTLGGYLQYKYGIFFPLVVSLWSILALSGTLAGEAQPRQPRVRGRDGAIAARASPSRSCPATS